MQSSQTLLSLQLSRTWRWLGVGSRSLPLAFKFVAMVGSVGCGDHASRQTMPLPVDKGEQPEQRTRRQSPSEDESRVVLDVRNPSAHQADVPASQPFVDQPKNTRGSSWNSDGNRSGPSNGRCAMSHRDIEISRAARAFVRRVGCIDIDKVKEEGREEVPCSGGGRVVSDLWASIDEPDDAPVGMDFRVDFCHEDNFSFDGGGHIYFPDGYLAGPVRIQANFSVAGTVSAECQANLTVDNQCRVDGEICGRSVEMLSQVADEGDP